MCCILPWKVTKLSVLLRWYWICSITGKKMLCKGMVYLGTFSRNLDEFHLPEGTAPFGWMAPGTVSSPPAPRSPEPPASARGAEAGGPWAMPAWPCLLPPYSSLSSLHLRYEKKRHCGSPSADSPQQRPFPPRWVLLGRHLEL